MKLLIIDDESEAIDLLEHYVARFSKLQLQASFRSSLAALDFLNKNTIDAVFLNIDMPQLSGMALSRLMDQKVKIIFTATHAQYAVESYEVNAVDYLLKPISFERFAQAVNKLFAGWKVKETTGKNSSGNFIYLKSGSRLFKVAVSSIDYLEKDGNYMTYHCGDKKIISRQTIKDALGLLPGDFIQIHKSYIITLDKIEFVDTFELGIANKKIAIGPQFKKSLMKRLGQ